MTTYIALLRAVNVGGRSLPMAGLRALLEEHGCQNPRTLLQSGNAVFARAGKPSAAALEKEFEAAAVRRFGIEVAFMLRTAAQWSAIVARNPLAAEAARDPAHLLLTALKAPPTAAAMRALSDAYPGPETVAIDGANAYIFYPNGIGRSKLTNALIERKLGVGATARNWNTVLKLAALAQA